MEIAAAEAEIRDTSIISRPAAIKELRLRRKELNNVMALNGISDDNGEGNSSLAAIRVGKRRL